MSIDIRIRSELDDITKKLKRNAEKAQKALAQHVLKDSNYYIPKDTGALETSGAISSTGKQVIWNTPYARRLYWNPQYNFSTDVNPNARGLWFEHAKQSKSGDWAKIVIQEYDK